MRIIILGLIFVFSMSVFAQGDNLSAVEEVRQAEAIRTQARIKGDNETMKKLVADDFVGVNRFGELRDRKYATSGKPLPSLAGESLNVRVFGDTAIAIGIASFTSPDGVDLVTRFTRVWHKRDGRWQNISHHGTTINDNSTSDKITEAEARNRLQDWINAYLNQDAKLLEDILDEDWKYAGGGSKEEAVENFKKSKDRFTKVNITNVKARIFGNIAIVTGNEELEILKADGTVEKVKLKFTDVFMKKNGKITAIATHSSAPD